MYENAGLGMQGKIFETETGEFGNAQACCEAYVQHGAVSDTGPVDGGGRIQERLLVPTSMSPIQIKCAKEILRYLDGWRSTHILSPHRMR